MKRHQDREKLSKLPDPLRSKAEEVWSENETTPPGLSYISWPTMHLFVRMRVQRSTVFGKKLQNPGKPLYRNPRECAEG